MVVEGVEGEVGEGLVLLSLSLLLFGCYRRRFCYRRFDIS